MQVFLVLTCLLQVAVAWNSLSIWSLAAATRDVQPPAPFKVLVTGAAGRTGRLVFDQLQQDDGFDPIALVRSERSGKKFIKDSGCGLEQVVVCDVVNDLLSNNPAPEGLEGTEYMIICTSAVPVLNKLSLVKALFKAPFNMISGKKAIDFRSFRFKFKFGQYPEKVDYEGQVAQIDLAQKLGVKRVVIVSSMGGTDPNNFLNKVGKNPDGSGNGDILLWKRKAERYLVDSDMAYTIIHPGGLVDTDPNVEELVLEVDDKLMENSKRSIGRADVASLCVASLSTEQNVSLDCITRAVPDGQVPRTARHVLDDFLKTGKTADYSL